MQSVFEKIRGSLSSEGLVATIHKIFLHIQICSKYKKMLDLNTAEERFTEIHKSNLWGLSESKSGAGSTLVYTENLRKALPEIFQTFAIKSILDAPCGDFNWMKEVIKDHSEMIYTGGDIVGPLIAQNQEMFSGKNIDFKVLNITKDSLPSADLMIVRDCLFHLSFADIHAFLENFSKSNLKFLLTTNHGLGVDYQNTDITTGDYRPINIFAYPFCFSGDPLMRIEDYIEPEEKREMCLFDRSQVQEALARAQTYRDLSIRPIF